MPKRFPEPMMVRKLLLAVAVFGLCGAAAAAEPCPIAIADISGALGQLGGSGPLVSDRVDPKSNEPIARAVVDFPDGSEIVVEQKTCVMENLTVTLLSPAATPTGDQLNVMGAALAATPVWQANFADVDPAAWLAEELSSEAFKTASGAATQFFYSPDDRLSAPDAQSETMLSFMSTDSFGAQFGSVLSLYIGIGGE